MCRRFISVSLSVLLLTSFIAMAPQTVSASTYTVTNTNDSGTGSLRDAIDQANANSELDIISFNIPGAGPHVIQPSSALPEINAPVFIDGYSQPGSSVANAGTPASLKVILDGTNAGSSAGLVLISGNNTISGLDIINFGHAGIVIGAAGGNIITGNYIGIDVSGDTGQANRYGIYVNGSSNNTIGGLTPDERNVISANTEVGIQIDNGSNNIVACNYIGTNATGAAVTGTQPNGITLGGSNNIIGGTSPGARNIISGHTNKGIQISGNTSTGNQIMGNFIGTNVQGNAVIPSGAGVVITGGPSANVVGGTSPGAGNVISGCAGYAISIGDSSYNNQVLGNLIGTDVTGTIKLGNPQDGIVLGSSNNIVGGTVPGARNVISDSGIDGITIINANNSGNQIIGNYIGTDITGTSSLGNTNNGIRIWAAHNNTIGGTALGAGNVISGNGSDGIHIYGASYSNIIQGNYVGTNTSGADLGNSIGINIYGSANNNIIGGNTIGARNVISGNNWAGVSISGTGSSSNVIQGNYIGTDITGSNSVSNSSAGIVIDDGPSNNTIGGNTPGTSNVISGNNNDGIRISRTTGNFVYGNIIGLTSSGSSPLPNGVGVNLGASNCVVSGNIISGNNTYGVWVIDGNSNIIEKNYIGTNSSGSVLGNITGIRIGGNSDNNMVGTDNTIWFNTEDGIVVSDETADFNTISQNSIKANGRSGIDLQNGGNDSIQAPIITSVTATTVTGTAGAPDSSVIEIFQDAGCQGNIYIGSATVSSSGSFTFTGSIPSSATGGNLTTTVTDPAGNTSEFSTPVENHLGTSSTPEEQIEEIQDVFDDAVSDGKLIGEGPGNSANGKLKALRNMLERAEELIDQGMIDDAIQQLEDAYKRVDGNPKPPDFAVGDEAAALAAMILNLIENLRNS